jgi:hypothetical protein
MSFHRWRTLVRDEGLGRAAVAVMVEAILAAG